MSLGGDEVLSFNPKMLTAATIYQHETPLAAMKKTSSFNSLQQSFIHQFRHAFPDRLAAKTIVVVPSLTLDREMLDKLTGHIYYEERMLCMLMLLRMPN